MNTRRKTQQNESLFPNLENDRRWETRGIFSEHYLRNRLTQSHLWPKDDFARPIYDFIMDLWKRRFVGLAKGNEELTRGEFLNKILEKLGFTFFSNLDLPESQRRQVPDYLLFEDEETKEKVFNEDGQVKYQAAIALMEAKKVHHPLDQVSKKETPGRFPHQQVRDYLNEATDKDGQPYFRWAVLSNGNVWRLYCRDVHPSSYFEFRLAGPDDYFCSYNDFKIFLTLFQPQVFVKKDGRCALDEIREESIVFQTDLEEDLRRRVFTVVVDLANGFWKYKDNQLTESELPELYNNCLIFLYRLLFILYAEGRGLLPVKLSGVGSNKLYRERFSLQRLIPQLKKGVEFKSNELTNLYEELIKLFHLINGDKPSLNKECSVPRYNGGLFNPKAHAKLEQWRVGEEALARVLRDLIFSAGHTTSSHQAEFEWGTIDYADLEVRQLGDIYEGLLGGHLELEDGNLVLRSEKGALQVSGTFYTPDWVVKFLAEKTLKPLIDEIEKNSEIEEAKKRKKKDNSFALKVLKLNILDNAMGSGHFLVRATEWLADQIVYHETTKFQMETVPPGISQELAEVAYWRRRVVEACIYGLDVNPLAAELSKLSLWLTCIATNEPLNFLDHHLRVGNSLIGARLNELSILPIHLEDEQIPFSFGKSLTDAVSDAIKEIEAIEEEASTEIDIVKKKEERWRDKVISRLEPFKQVANVWIAATSGLEINESEYTTIANGLIDPSKPRTKEHKELKKVWEVFHDDFERITKHLNPFHYELEFPDVFFDEDGKRKENPGFDAILGNPPYISTQTSSEFEYRNALKFRFKFVDDLYTHFVFQGFNLLRTGGTFGYVISDTFFTLSTKSLMRDLLQCNRLMYLGQCDPFKATVDAAIFVAHKEKAKDNYDLLFVQARYANDKGTPDKDLEKLAEKPTPLLVNGTVPIESNGTKRHILHGTLGCLRLHRVDVNSYRYALKSAFFEPTQAITQLYNKFNDPLKKLVSEWWEKVETSKRFDDNREEISRYHKTLKPGDISLVGLIADGGQGMRTANNGRFLGFLEGTEQAQGIDLRKKELTKLWTQHPKVSVEFRKLLEERKGDFETAVEPLKVRFDPLRDLGLKRGEIYRTVSEDSIANEEDFTRAYELRKPELEELWKESKEFKTAYKKYKEEYGHNFCKIFVALAALATKQNIALTKLGIRSGEFYDDESDAPRIATIYRGLSGKQTWVQFRKGDPEGNKWTDIEPLFIRWNCESVSFLFDNSGRPESTMPVVRNAHLYFTEGVTYTLLGNHVALKAKLQPKCVFDAGASRLTPIIQGVSAYTFLAVLNSNIFSFIIRKFIKNTAAYEINDVRMAPFVIPSKEQAEKLETLAKRAVVAKELTLKKQDPSLELIKYCRQLVKEQQRAPKYLQPHHQLLLLDSAEDCLNAIELAVQWEVEKLYDVEGMGPFEEF